MAPESGAVRLLGVSGSLRAGSYNTQVLKAFRARLGDTATLTIYPLHDLPSYNQDLDHEHTPEAVLRFKQAIREAEGLVLCSPEYNYGMSGVLKNAIDWASRPAMQSVFRAKPVLLMTCSPSATGGARAHGQMREAMSACQAWVLPLPQITIADAKIKFSAEVLTAPNSLAAIERGSSELVAWIRTRRKQVS